MKKKLFCILLSLSMLLCFMPQSAWAATSWDSASVTQDNTGKTIKTVTVASESELTTAVDGVTNTDTNVTCVIKLNSNIELDDTLTISGKTVTLDLNGKVLSIKNGEEKSVIKVTSNNSVHGNLTITDTGSGTHHFKFADEDHKKGLDFGGYVGLWQWLQDDKTGGVDGYNTVYGGVITGGKANGGGIYVDSNCTLTLQKGNIVGCKASNGGGVYNNGAFTMNGGNIQGCWADSYGGGVYGNVTMNGGTIQGCWADINGGGVNGNVTMHGGEITYCCAKNCGGGVSGVVIISGGKISSCATKDNEGSKSAGGGVYGSVSMSGGTISDCSASESVNGQLNIVLTSANEKGGGVYITDSIHVSGGTISCDIVIVPGNMTEENNQKVGGTISGSIYILPYFRNTSEGGNITIEPSGSNAAIGSVHVAPGVTATLNDVKVRELTLYASTSDDDKTKYSNAVIGSGTTVANISYADNNTISTLTNNGTINGGEFYGPVTNSGTINNSKFENKSTLTNSGTITSSTFESGSTATNSGTISDSTFKSGSTLIQKSGSLVSSTTINEGATSKADSSIESTSVTVTLMDVNAEYAKLTKTTTDAATIAITKPGYTFEGLYTDSDLSSAATDSDFEKTNDGKATIKSTEAKKFYIKWAENANYTVKFNTNGSENIADVTGVKWTDNISSKLKNVSVAKLGYIFNGWKCGSTAVVETSTYASLAVSEKPSIELAAQWTECTNHEYTDSYDTTCNLCGYTRTIYHGSSKKSQTVTDEQKQAELEKAAAEKKAVEIAEVKTTTAGLDSLKARSSRTAKGNVKVVAKLSTAEKAKIAEFKELGYTVKYRFYRGAKKSSEYKAMLTGTAGIYYNTYGEAGTRYYYKVQIRVYDADGTLIAKTELKDCKYATRIF